LEKHGGGVEVKSAMMELFVDPNKLGSIPSTKVYVQGGFGS